jgi:hypothetical protein
MSLPHVADHLKGATKHIIGKGYVSLAHIYVFSVYPRTVYRPNASSSRELPPTSVTHECTLFYQDTG